MGHVRVALGSVTSWAPSGSRTGGPGAGGAGGRGSGRNVTKGRIRFSTTLTSQLSSLLRRRSRKSLEGLYSGGHLSACQIARITEVNHSVVLVALDRFGIPQNGNGRRHSGQLPSGMTTGS